MPGRVSAPAAVEPGAGPRTAGAPHPIRLRGVGGASRCAPLRASCSTLGDMREREILEGVAAVAREHLGYEGALRPDMRLVEDLELDSIRLLTLAVEVENRFRVCLDEDDEQAIETVGDLVAVVRRELGSRQGGSGDAPAETSSPPLPDPTP